MWSRGVQLVPERQEAWLQALKPCLNLAGAIVDGSAEEATLEPVRVTDVAHMFGVDERVATGVYGSLEGETKGLLMFESTMPGTRALNAADAVFKVMAMALGGMVTEPWLLIDMRTTLAETLAVQTAGLRLEVMVTAPFCGLDGTEIARFAFIPDWEVWNGRSLEARREAA